MKSTAIIFASFYALVLTASATPSARIPFNGVPLDVEGATRLQNENRNIVLFVKDGSYILHDLTTSTSSAAVGLPSELAGKTIAAVSSSSYPYAASSKGHHTFAKETQKERITFYVNDGGNSISEYKYGIVKVSATSVTFDFIWHSPRQFSAPPGNWWYGGLYDRDYSKLAYDADSQSTDLKGDANGVIFVNGNSVILYTGKLAQTRGSRFMEVALVQYGGRGQPFENLPSHLDAAYTVTENGTPYVYAFKGDKYYKLSLTTVQHVDVAKRRVNGDEDTGLSITHFNDGTPIKFPTGGRLIETHTRTGLTSPHSEDDLEKWLRDGLRVLTKHLFGGNDAPVVVHGRSLRGARAQLES